MKKLFTLSGVEWSWPSKKFPFSFLILFPDVRYNSVFRSWGEQPKELIPACFLLPRRRWDTIVSGGFDSI